MNLVPKNENEKGGLIIVKENVYDDRLSLGEFNYDKSDNSVIRSSRQLKLLF